MAWTKAKTAIIAGVGILVAAGGTVSIWEYNYSPRFWEHRFEAAYKLKPGEKVRYIHGPFVSARADFYHNEPGLRSQAAAISKPPDVFVFTQAGQNTPTFHTLVFGATKNSIEGALSHTMGFKRYEVDDPDGLLDLSLSGDWTVRKDISRDDFLAALEPIIFKATKRHVHFQKQTVDREVIVVRGKLNFDPDDPGSAKTVIIYANDPKSHHAQSGRGLANLATPLGGYLNLRIVDETQASDHWNWEITTDAFKYDRKLHVNTATDKILKNLSDQTGLTFTREQRPEEIWFVTEQK